MLKLKAFLWLFLFAIIYIVYLWLQILIIPIATILAIFGKGKYQRYGINCWEGEDNKISAHVGGDPDESMSSRLGKARIRGSGWSYIADQVDLVAYQIFNDPHHCERSIEKDRGGKQVTTY